MAIMFAARPATSNVLLSLALSHHLQAERSTCPEQQTELRRIADIYLVLAAMGMPAEVFTRLVKGEAQALH